MIHYRYEASKMYAQNNLGYGFAFLFVFGVVGLLPYLQGNLNPLYTGISLIMLVLGIRKFFKGIKTYQKLKKDESLQ